MINKFSQSQLTIAENMAAYMRYGVPIPFFVKYNHDYFWVPSINRYVQVVNINHNQEIDTYSNTSGSEVYLLKDLATKGKEVSEAEFWKNYNEALYALEKICHKRHEYIAGITHVADLPKPSTTINHPPIDDEVPF